MADKRKNNTQDPTDFANALTKPKGASMASRLSGTAAASGVETFTADSFEQVMEEYQFGAKVVTLEQGQGFRNVLYIGPGSPVETTDVETGEPKALPTHEFELPDGVRVKLIESHQMRVELPPLIGQRIVLIRGGAQDTKKGRRVTEYLIGPAKSLSGGK